MAIDKTLYIAPIEPIPLGDLARAQLISITGRELCTISRCAKGSNGEFPGIAALPV
jgi:hypothetical protein